MLYHGYLPTSRLRLLKRNKRKCTVIEYLFSSLINIFKNFNICVDMACLIPVRFSLFANQSNERKESFLTFVCYSETTRKLLCVKWCCSHSILDCGTSTATTSTSSVENPLFLLLLLLLIPLLILVSSLMVLCTAILCTCICTQSCTHAH